LFCIYQFHQNKLKVNEWCELYTRHLFKMGSISEDNFFSSDQKDLFTQELEQTKEEVKEMIHMLDDLRHNFKNETEEISHKLRERSEVYSDLEKKLSILPEIYGKEIEEIVALQQEKKERIHYQNTERYNQINDRLRMLDTKVSGIEIEKERNADMGVIEEIKSRDLVIKSISGLIHLLILIFHALFFVLSIPSDIIKSFTRSAPRFIITTLLVTTLSMLYVYYDELVILYAEKMKGINR